MVSINTDLIKNCFNLYETQSLYNNYSKIANKYYDLIFVDIDNGLKPEVKDSLLENSDIIIGCIPQNIRCINEYITSKKEDKILQEKLVMPLIGKYDTNSKYNDKNISKYIKEKEGVSTIPYNTQFMEACNEGKVSDYFIKYRNVGKKDKNAPFVVSVSETAQKIIYKLQELQMKI